MAAGWLCRRLCQSDVPPSIMAISKSTSSILKSENEGGCWNVLYHLLNAILVIKGSIFPVNYASRIMQKQCFLPSSNLIGIRLAGSHVDTQEPKTNPLVSVSDEPETLYKRLSLLVKSHDKAVLESYEYFAVLAAKELGISVEKVYNPPKTIERLTLLKSVHIYKKHRVQYEMRTHYLCLELKHLTSSTAAVYLEYVQRNLPEGVAMEVKKTKIEKIPEHIREPVWDTLPQVEETEVKS